MATTTADASLAERAFELLPDDRQTILKAVIVLSDAVTAGDLPAFLTFEPAHDGIGVTAGTVGYSCIQLGTGPYHWRRRPDRGQTEAPEWRENPTKAVEDLLDKWGLS